METERGESMTLGEMLLELRKKQHLSQEEAAEKLKVTRQTISKWETNQSTPDFDKIIPICELYQISSEELLTGVKKEEKEKKLSQKNTKNVKFLILGIFLYFMSVICVILGVETLRLNDGIVVSIFLGLCAIATCCVIYYGINLPKKEEYTKKQTPQEKLKNSVIDITAIAFFIFYLIVSFATMAWHITWILWVVYAAVEEIIKTGFESKGEQHEK